MINCDVIYLIAESPEAHGIFSPPAESERMVFCEVNSVSRYEFWRAKENGVTPTYVFRLSDQQKAGKKPDDKPTPTQAETQTEEAQGDG